MAAPYLSKIKLNSGHLQRYNLKYFGQRNIQSSNKRNALSVHKHNKTIIWSVEKARCVRKWQKLVRSY